MEERKYPFGSDVLRTVVGGGTGAYDNPYTLAEAESMMDAYTWYGGYVEGMGYVMRGVTIYGYNLWLQFWI